MTLRLLPLLALLAGCAPAVVGTIDLRTPPPTIAGQRLLVVVAPQMAGARSKSTPDSVKAAEFVPLAEIGAASYRGIAVDTLVAALRASGRWADVRVGPLPAGVDLVRGTFRVITPVPRQLDPRYSRETLAAPAASPGAFGPDVDAVLVVSDAVTGFGKAPIQYGIGPPNPATGGVGVLTTAQGDDSVVTRAALVLWDDATGAVAGVGVPVGAERIRGRLFSSAESRTPRTLARKSREAFLKEAAEALPALGLPD